MQEIVSNANDINLFLIIFPRDYPVCDQTGHDSLSKSHNVLASLLRIFFDTEVIPSIPDIKFQSSIISSYIPIVVVIAKMFHKHGRASYSSIRLHIKLPLHFSLLGFLGVFAFLTFALSAALSSEYSSKLLLCCSSQDDGNAVAILH